jgi:pseudouridine-5'-phosphate glycosidase
VSGGDSPIIVSDRVAEAIAARSPVVALESTIVTHGLPRPRNLEAAIACERAVVDGGAVPATIAAIDGIVRVGLSDDELEHVATTPAPAKLSARDLPVAVAQRLTGGTTVAATAFVASRCGIRVFATGGIGGVHREASATFDESADLGVLGRCRITVVSAGVKSILDVGATLERLETLSVPVVAYRTRRFPGFWLTDSGCEVEFSVNSPDEIAHMMRAADALGLPGGLLVANPVPAERQLARDVHDGALEGAMHAARARGVRGKEMTPFLLEYVHESTRHASLEINVEIVLGNCELGAAIARAWCG